MGFGPQEKQVFLDARMACPYLLDRSERGLDTPAVLPPDPEDMWAHRAAKAATWVQAKHHVRESTSHRGLLPRGLDPIEHAKCAWSLSSPFAAVAGVADDLDYACRMTVQLGHRAKEWISKRFEEFNRLANRLMPLRESLEQGRSPASKKVTGHVHLERLLLATHAIA